MPDGKYTVKITTQAEEQLQEIVKYIASQLKAPIAALRLLNDNVCLMKEAAIVLVPTSVDYQNRPVILYYLVER